VQIEEAAGVDAFLMGEPWLLPCGGYGPVATEAYGVAGAIVIAPVLEVEAVRGELKNFGGHEWPAFKRWNDLTLYSFYASEQVCAVSADFVTHACPFEGGFRDAVRDANEARA
jgi:hypothetical protein